MILGVFEGVTEYLPISSTGHLILAAWILGFGDDPERWSAVVKFSIVIQAGAIVAVFFLYRERIRTMVFGVLGRDDDGRRLLGHLVVAFLPAVVVGLLMDDLIEKWLADPKAVAVALFAGALLMLAVSARSSENKGKGIESLNWRMALWIGCAQCVAMWPGTSRSMMTIVAAMLLGLSPVAAAEFSFLLGLITLTAATGYKLILGGSEMIAQFGVESLVIGMVAAMVSAGVAVKWFVAFLNRWGLAPFAWYRLVLSVVLAMVIWGGWLSDVGG